MQLSSFVGGNSLPRIKNVLLHPAAKGIEDYDICYQSSRRPVNVLKPYGHHHMINDAAVSEARGIEDDVSSQYDERMVGPDLPKELVIR